MFRNYTVMCKLSGKEKTELYPNEVADTSINCRPSATSGEIKNQQLKGHKSVVSQQMNQPGKMQFCAAAQRSIQQNQLKFND